MSTVKEIIKQVGCVVDVRTPAEFQRESVPDAINIPLNEIPMRIEEIRKLKGPIVLCCASGSRSGQAHRFLLGHGIDCVNGGSWFTVNSSI